MYYVCANSSPGVLSGDAVRQGCRTLQNQGRDERGSPYSREWQRHTNSSLVTAFQAVTFLYL